MNGVVVVDKPRGVTSFDVVAACRRQLKQKRVGHTGTLDPMATGVLPVCVGEATKLVPFLMARDKAYQAEALLGVATDTLDADGTVVRETPAAHLARADVEQALAGFVGVIQQRPPMHSAIRVNGKRLYELAREGQEVEREPRPVHVRSITLDAFAVEGPAVRIRFSVECGKGTYIRSIAGDLGDRLGVGAHLTALRRTRVGTFLAAGSTELERVGEARLLGLAEALADLATLTLDDAQARDVRDGKLKALERLPVPAGVEPGGYVRLLRPDGSLLAVASAHGEEASLRLRLERVFTLTNDLNS